MIRKERLEKMAALFKNANWECPNCGAQNPDTAERCENCTIPKDPTLLEHTAHRVWGDLEYITHLLMFAMKEDNWQEVKKEANQYVHSIKKHLWFSPDAPFKKFLK